MIKIRKFMLAALALSTLAVTSTLALPAAASAESEEEPISASVTNSDYDHVQYAGDSVLSPPNLDYKEYNAAVQFIWQAGEGADALAMYTSANPYVVPDIYKTTTFRVVSFPAVTGYKNCEPWYDLAASYNTETGLYSAKTSALHTDENTSIERYSRDAKYNVVGKVDLAVVSGNVPTSYDQTNYIWTHNASYRRDIMGTVSYHGYAANISVYVPLMGYKEASVKLDGVTFYLRTGPNKCSVKAGSSGVSVGDFGFGFGVK